MTPFSTCWRRYAGLPSEMWPRSSGLFATTFTVATALDRHTGSIIGYGDHLAFFVRHHVANFVTNLDAHAALLQPIKGAWRNGVAAVRPFPIMCSKLRPCSAESKGPRQPNRRVLCGFSAPY